MLLLKKVHKLVGVLSKNFYDYFVSWIAFLIVAMVGVFITLKEKNVYAIHIDFINNLLDRF